MLKYKNNPILSRGGLDIGLKVGKLAEIGYMLHECALWHKVDISIFQWQWSYKRARALNCCCKSTDSNQSPFKISRFATNLIVGVLLHMKCWIVTKNIMNRYIWTNSYVNSYIIINFFYLTNLEYESSSCFMWFNAKLIMLYHITVLTCYLGTFSIKNMN